MENMRDILVAMSVKQNGDWNRMYTMLKNKEQLSKEEIHQNYSKVGSNVLTIIDPDYSSKLKNCWHPPLCLYYYGDISLLNSNKVISVVGTRNCNEYSRNSVTKIVKEAIEKDRDIVICSGMAKGIDAAAMRAAMEAGGKVIGVLGSGIERVYPEENKDIYDYCKEGKGLILSEWPMEVAPEKDNFPFRNRLIATLGDILFVGQCDSRSGTSTSVKYSLELGKSIYVLPQHISPNDMSNQLIKDGAEVVTKTEDLLDGLNKKF